MQHFTGISASSGLALGAARRLRHTQSGLGRASRTPEAEQRTVELALRRARDELENLALAADPHDREIYRVQGMLLGDDGLRAEIDSYIRVGAPAAAAVERAAGIFAQRMRDLEDAYMRERACDILDACGRVVKILDDKPLETLRLTGPAILVAEELYPTDIATLDRNLVQGFLTRAGSPDAHAAMIARMMGIPAVVMAGDALPLECDGMLLALDGDTGEAYLEPDEATKARFTHRLRQKRMHDAALADLLQTPCRTRDGTRVTLLADCATVDDVRSAVAGGADGISLLLGEYLMANYASSEEKQLRFYRACLAAAGGRPVTVCVFDGALEPLRRGVPSAENPALGLRGARYCLAHPDFFETQLCALLRAATEGDLRILVPMISTREEFERVLEAVEAAKRRLRQRADPFADNVPVGVLLETPASALLSAELARRASFFHMEVSVLAQYTFAADRADPRLRAYRQSSSPAMYQLLRLALEAAAGARLGLCVCGEEAARPALAETYVRMGVRTFSLPTRELLAVKEYLMGVTL